MESSTSVVDKAAATVIEREYRFPRAFFQGNTATFATYAVGVTTISLFCWPAAVIYAFYCVASTVAMWATVCVNCPYYGGVCPCGYSTMSTALFRKGDVRLMPKRYRLIWAYVAPSWLAPVFAAAPILVFQFSWFLFIAVTVFALMAFLITPAISKVAGCCEYWRGCTVPDADARSGS
jgi:hypothetical protein